MSKSIELTQSQSEALKSGATMFIFPIKNIEYYDFLDNGIYNISNPIFRKDRSWSYSDFITAPIHKGDKDIFVKNTQYSFNECIDVRVVRVQDIEYKDLCKMKLLKKAYWQQDIQFAYNQQLKEKNINRTYEDNDYVFLVEFA